MSQFPFPSLRPHVNERGRAKKAYGSLEEAQEAARGMGGSKRRPYHAYLCPVCERPHVGRKPPKGKRDLYARRRGAA